MVAVGRDRARRLGREARRRGPRPRARSTVTCASSITSSSAVTPPSGANVRRTRSIRVASGSARTAVGWEAKRQPPPRRRRGCGRSSPGSASKSSIASVIAIASSPPARAVRGGRRRGSRRARGSSWIVCIGTIDEREAAVEREAGRVGRRPCRREAGGAGPRGERGQQLRLAVERGDGVARRARARARRARCPRRRRAPARPARRRARARAAGRRRSRRTRRRARRPASGGTAHRQCPSTWPRRGEQVAQLEQRRVGGQRVERPVAVGERRVEPGRQPGHDVQPLRRRRPRTSSAAPARPRACPSTSSAARTARAAPSRRPRPTRRRARRRCCR